jgi:DNA-binding GntR family transcriptional regulator
MSIQRGDDAWRTRVRSAHAKFCGVKQKIGDRHPISEDWEKPHRDFHLALVSACSSPTLLHFWSKLHDRFDRYRRVALPSRSHMGALGEDHESIMEAALKGKRDEAMTVLARHIEDTAALIEQYFEPAHAARGAGGEQRNRAAG